MVLDTLKVKWPKGCMIPYHSLNQIDTHIETVCAYARARQTTSWTWLGSSARQTCFHQPPMLVTRPCLHKPFLCGVLAEDKVWA